MKLEKIRQKPVKIASITLILLFWMLTPLIAQKYFNYSAINVSFAVTVFYFVVWKVYDNKEKFLNP